MRLPSSGPLQSGSRLSPHIDPSQWNRLIEEAGPAAMKVVIASSMGRQLRSQCTAEDLWQETLAKAWSARGQYQWRGRAAFRAWLFEIARNRIRDAVRNIQAQKRGAGRPAARFSELESGGSKSASAMLPPDSTTPSRKLMRAEKAAALEKALAALPPDLEPVVRMHLLDGLTMEVIARRLGIGISAAWRRFRKGSALFRDMCSEWKSSAVSRRK
jgi:RNA polymerase sigma factor (sigma-70 family)